MAGIKVNRSHFFIFGMRMTIYEGTTCERYLQAVRMGCAGGQSCRSQTCAPGKGAVNQFIRVNPPKSDFIEFLDTYEP